tara:strand:+ start:466 stop:882 length:417 start_codon:yes stop_codon:yes gene_type:complete
MAQALGVTVLGEKELKKKLGNPKKLRKPIEKYLERASIQLKDNVKPMSPVRSSSMRKAWNHTLKATRNDVVARVFNTETNKGVFYAVPLEFGVNLKPSSSDPRIRIPFLKPAYEQLLKQLGKLKVKLGKDIDREYKKP